MIKCVFPELQLANLFTTLGTVERQMFEELSFHKIAGGIIFNVTMQLVVCTC